MITFQEMLKRLMHYWEKQGCILHQGYDLETGAGTFNPTTFLRTLGPEPYRAVYIEPCRRPSDGRYGTNPNRVQHYFQGQVVMKPSPPDILELTLKSLEAIGFNLSDHDMRFVHDDWESPTLGAWGLGWEVWMDGMEVTQFTYFQSLGGVTLKPVTAEITYGLERLALYLQKVDSIFDLQYNDEMTYGDIYFNSEVQWSHYNFEKADSAMWLRHFEDYENEAKRMITAKLPLPAYDFVAKASHAFNLLDARGVISVTERMGYICRIRELARQIAESYIQSREAIQYPLLKKFHKNNPEKALNVPPIDKCLLDASPQGKCNFLLEIGSEELPASFVGIGVSNLENAFKKLLQKEGLDYTSLRTEGTPRRLMVYVEGLVLVKSTQIVERKGPALSQAFDANGQLTNAGEGFFRSIGKEPMSLQNIRESHAEDLEIRTLKSVEYLFAHMSLPGKATAEILAEKIPDLILSLEFPKKMRWGDLDITYARPIRWIVALLGTHIIPFAVGNIISDRISWGHRQLSPKSFSIARAEEYFALLIEHHVIISAEERLQRISQGLDQLETEIDAQVIAREQVLPVVVNLVEWPEVTMATFDSQFLKIPKEVLISEMVEHQKYFPVASADGSLKNVFVITANTIPTDAIRSGNQKVLSARLSDGVFLYEQGLKTPLEALNEKLKTVTFQKELGTMYQKVERLERHALYLQKVLKISTPQRALRAAVLSKADLASEMVYEFPDLQGVIGRCYALANGEEDDVAYAIEEQWMPRGEKASLPVRETGILLSIADKMDNLVGCFAANLKPTSSSDPYALRRQALGIIKIVIQSKLILPLHDTFATAISHFPLHLQKDKEKLLEELKIFIVNRVKSVFLEYSFHKDEIEAALSAGCSDIYEAYCKVDSLHRFRKNSSHFAPLYEVYRRAKGQLQLHTSPHAASFSPELLQEPAEKELNVVLNEIDAPLYQAIATRNYDLAYELVAKLQAPLAQLFEHVKILDDNAALKANRIALLQRIFSHFLPLLDFSKIQIL